jgi:hypothetical protein
MIGSGESSRIHPVYFAAVCLSMPRDLALLPGLFLGTSGGLSPPSFAQCLVEQQVCSPALPSPSCPGIGSSISPCPGIRLRPFFEGAVARYLRPEIR